jgi:predicted DNA-binding protein (MmcQ/YjbR family)
MAYDWLNEYCLAKPGVTTDYQADWEATRYFIGGKLFAMVGSDKTSKPIVTMKLDPIFGQLLRNEYAEIIPGYHMNKIHWNSLYLDGRVPTDVLREMLDQAYAIVLATLNKKTQAMIKDLGEETSC